MAEDAPPQRNSGGVFLVAAVAFCASVIGVFWYNEHFREKPAAVVDKNGFDLEDVSRSPDSSKGGAASSSGQKSGLGMINAISGMQFGQKEQAAGGSGGTPSPTSAAIGELIRATEAKIKALAVEYTRRYPVIRQYGVDWMSYPDLKRLNDDYMRTHDPFAFMKGLAGAPNFGKIVQKYSVEPPVRNFVMDTIKTAPPEAIPTVMDYVNKNDSVKVVADNVGKSLGLPPGLLGNYSGTGSKIDGTKVMQQVQSQQAP